MSTAVAPPSPQSTAAATRKFKALVAYLLSSDIQDTSDPHPIVANATVADFNRAMEEVNRKTKCPLLTTYSKWFGGQPFSIGCANVAWTTFKDARYAGMKHLAYRHGYSCYFYNAIEMLQVCYRCAISNGKYFICFHLESRVCGEVPSYYRMELGASNRVINCVRLLELPVKRFSVRRNPTGSISGDAWAAMVAHKKSEPVDPRMDELLKVIATLRT